MDKKENSKVKGEPKHGLILAKCVNRNNDIFVMFVFYFIIYSCIQTIYIQYMPLVQELADRRWFNCASNIWTFLLFFFTKLKENLNTILF